MTRDEIEAMEGLALDAAVGEALGWPIQAQGPYDWPHLRWNEDPTIECLWLCRLVENGGYTVEIWSPSKSIAHAWTLVPEIRKVFKYDACIKIGWAGDNDYWCEVFDQSSLGYINQDGSHVFGQDLLTVEATTAATAICRAFLLAKAQEK